MQKLALVLSLALAVVGGFLLFVYLRRYEVERSGGAPVEVLVVVNAIKRDTPVEEDMIAVREVPTAYVDSRAVRASEKARILGIRVVNSVQPGQVLTWTDIAVGGNDRRSLSSLVQPGFRAISVKTRNDNTSYDLIEPGDRVDVITTIDTESQQKRSVVLLQNVLVLAVGTDTGGEAAAAAAAGKASSAPRRGEQILTLSLKIPEAQLLAVALEKGHVTVALRNPDDTRVTEAVPDLGSNVIGDQRERTRVSAVRRTAATPNLPGAF